ncbi:MAG TPA: hypothetical protein VIX41_03075 [Acidimicrobiales bacterium]
MARVGERRVRAGIGAAVAVAALAAVTLAASTPAGAGGGDWLYPDRDRYEGGQQVRLVGYTEALARSTSDDRVLAEGDLRGNGPYYAYLRDPAAVERDPPPDGSPWPYVHPTDRRMGQVTVEQVTPAANRYNSLRVSMAFRLPRGLAPRTYDVIVCNDPCTTTLGWLVGSFLYVGIDPPEPLVRPWPLDDPAIDFLGDDALVAAPVCEADCTGIDDWSVTAAEIRAGYRPLPVTVPPEPEPAAGTATTAAPVSEPVAGAGKSPAGRAGADPAGGVPSEVVAWVTGFGVLLVVWCLAWRWRPREARMVVRQGNGQHDHGSTDDDPDTVHIKL